MIFHYVIRGRGRFNNLLPSLLSFLGVRRRRVLNDRHLLLRSTKELKHSFLMHSDLLQSQDPSILSQSRKNTKDIFENSHLKERNNDCVLFRIEKVLKRFNVVTARTGRAENGGQKTRPLWMKQKSIIMYRRSKDYILYIPTI